MKFLESFNGFGSVDGVIKEYMLPTRGVGFSISDLYDAISDCMLPLEDVRFEKSQDEFGDSMLVEWERPRVTNNSILIIGKIQNGKIDFERNSYSESDSEIVDELLNSIYILSGITGSIIEFSFTNDYNDLIIIEILNKEKFI